MIGNPLNRDPVLPSRMCTSASKVRFAGSPLAFFTKKERYGCSFALAKAKSVCPVFPWACSKIHLLIQGFNIEQIRLCGLLKTHERLIQPAQLSQSTALVVPACIASSYLPKISMLVDIRLMQISGESPITFQPAGPLAHSTSFSSSTSSIGHLCSSFTPCACRASRSSSRKAESRAMSSS